MVAPEDSGTGMISPAKIPSWPAWTDADDDGF
jgi:hypothetical protein